MFDIVIKYITGNIYDNRLPIWVVVNGTKGYHNDVPIELWNAAFRNENNNIVFYTPIDVTDAVDPQNPITKEVYDVHISDYNSHITDYNSKLGQQDVWMRGSNLQMDRTNGIPTNEKVEKGEKGDKSEKGDGFKLTPDNHFHRGNKRLTNVENPIDLGDAVNKKHLDDRLKTKENTSYVHNELAKKVSTTKLTTELAREVDTVALADYMTSSDIYTALQEKGDKAALNDYGTDTELNNAPALFRKEIMIQVSGAMLYHSPAALCQRISPLWRSLQDSPFGLQEARQGYPTHEDADQPQSQSTPATPDTAHFGTKQSLLFVIPISTHVEAIHIRLHPNNINRDSGIEIAEARMPTIKIHSSRRTVRQQTTEGK
ncbi:hypothetical protein AWC38_SpisGene24684 [Stylophora pistillata]|uniref:Uncharacterized protein n=1 Tax=Stylophora pistillata TaxID=50429 RepID=A0A2B4R420_STYPI|nr:hypothetical protein AWC38_SpisGene24684 [Stylophora pistillata]